MPAQKHSLKISTEEVRSRLKLKSYEARSKFSEKYSRAQKLLKQKGLDIGKIREHSAKVISTGAIAGALFLAPPSNIKYLPTPFEIIGKLGLEEGKEKNSEKEENLSKILKSMLPKNPRPLERNEEKTLELVFRDVLGVTTKANLEGEHLNTTYGYIGAEQHLRRYPGDKLANHGEGKVLREGMAPGLSAWGYFAKDQDSLSGDLVETERWYAVVQTLYLPDWNMRQPYLKNWYKYRKVLIVNTENGKSVVAAISDSGPAAWTGKQFGGSPEVMNYLGGERYKKGSVLLFFVDDPENKVPLGPLQYN